MRKKELLFLVMYLIIFGIILLVSVYDLSANRVMFDIGMPATLTNAIIIAFCILGMLKTIYHIASY